MAYVPYQRDIATSRLAAAGFRARAASLVVDVYMYIRDNGPCTDNDLIQHFTGEGWSANSIRPRRIELANKAIVWCSGIVVQDNGRPACEWETT